MPDWPIYRAYLRNAALVALGIAILLAGANESFAALCVMVTAFTIPSVIYQIWFKQTDKDLRLY